MIDVPSLIRYALLEREEHGDDRRPLFFFIRRIMFLKISTDGKGDSDLEA